ncbi:MAG: GTP-dependent dephospho-CoA kinase family protein [Candidatus Helarchaeota archaeon]
MEKRKYILRLTEELRVILKKPLGLLLEGSERETTKKAIKLLDAKNPPLIIAVGDVCVRSLLQRGIKLNLAIIDGKTLRTSDEFVDIPADVTIEIENPQGYLMPHIWDTIERIYSSNVNTELFVVGEEDLLTLPCVLLAPLKSVVFYGQPPIPAYNMNAGLVMITVTPEKKEEFLQYLNAMEVVDKI